MATTPTRPIRVDLDLWDDFGDAARAIGSDRTKVLVGFMRRFVDAMDARLTAEAQSVDSDQGEHLSASAP
jgi:hypothetical protein